MSPELHLGITPWRGVMDAEAVASQAELSERWGYQSFFLPESHFVAGASIPDPLLLLAAAAARTRKIRLGTSSWLLPIRQPLLAAEQAASLDQLCGGRLVLGLGRGYNPGMLAAFGVTNADKRDRFEQVLNAMLDAWSGEPVEEQRIEPKPRQKPHPPLWVAAFGPRAIAQSGRLGLPYFASPIETLSELEANFARHAEALAENGHDGPAVSPAMRTIFIAEEPARLDAVRTKLAELPPPPFRKGPAPAPEDWCLLGNAAEVREQVAYYTARLGITHLVAVRPRVSGLETGWLTDSFEALAGLGL